MDFITVKHIYCDLAFNMGIFSSKIYIYIYMILPTPQTTMLDHNTLNDTVLMVELSHVSQGLFTSTKKLSHPNDYLIFFL
jgi:hypothetical protein